MHFAWDKVGVDKKCVLKLYCLSFGIEAKRVEGDLSLQLRAPFTVGQVT
jgi:hypothetical protein